MLGSFPGKPWSFTSTKLTGDLEPTPLSNQASARQRAACAGLVSGHFGVRRLAAALAVVPGFSPAAEAHPVVPGFSPASGACTVAAVCPRRIFPLANPGAPLQGRLRAPHQNPPQPRLRNPPQAVILSRASGGEGSRSDSGHRPRTRTACAGLVSGHSFSRASSAQDKGLGFSG
jgi:hypothetical protein